MKYDVTEQGFVLHLGASIYARPAVMKAFYHLQGGYIISYERRGGTLDAYFDCPGEPIGNLSERLRGIMEELSFEMLRYDTLRETSNLRELLVGRALYASCVDLGSDAEYPAPEKGDEMDSWTRDRARIFESWTDEA